MQVNITQLLNERKAARNPLRVGLIGAGKTGAMLISQLGRIPGVHLYGVGDLSYNNVQAAMKRAGWPEERYTARNNEEAIRTERTFFTEDIGKLIAAPGMDVIVEATGVQSAGIRHAIKAIECKRHIVMLTAESDVLVGPLLAEKAGAAGVVYSMGYGDQPSLICELVEWARSCGFDVVCAGTGSRHLPNAYSANPDNVWQYHGFSAERIARGEDNPRLYTTFADGTKTSIEMALVANDTKLIPQPEGLSFPPCSVDDLQTILRPISEGGVLTKKGTVECASSIDQNGRPVQRDIRRGVYVIFEVPDDFIKRSLEEFGVKLDPSKRYAAMYRPYHLVGLELSVSVLRAGLLNQATGSSTYFVGDVVARAKRSLSAGEKLDGEGGYTVYGTLRPAKESVKSGEVPIGLASEMRLKRPVGKSEIIHWSDVAYDESDFLISLRREMESRFAKQNP